MTLGDLCDLQGSRNSFHLSAFLQSIFIQLRIYLANMDGRGIFLFSMYELIRRLKSHDLGLRLWPTIVTRNIFHLFARGISPEMLVGWNRRNLFHDFEGHECLWRSPNITSFSVADYWLDSIRWVEWCIDRAGFPSGPRHAQVQWEANIILWPFKVREVTQGH